MKDWNELSMRERAAFIKVGVKNGITNIDSIRELYNHYSLGGSLEEDKYAHYTPRQRKLLERSRQATLNILALRNKKLTTLPKQDIKDYQLIMLALTNKANTIRTFGNSYKEALLKQEQQTKESLLPYKLMANSLATAAELGSSAYMLGKGVRTLGFLPNNRLLNGIYQSDRGLVIANSLGTTADAYQLLTADSTKDKIENGIELPADVAGIVGGTNWVRNSNFFGRYGNTIDNILDFAGYSAAGYDGIIKPLEGVYNKFDDGGDLKSIINSTKNELYYLGVPVSSTEDNPVLYNELKELLNSISNSDKVILKYNNIKNRMVNRRLEQANLYDIPNPIENEITLSNAGSMTGAKLSTNLLDSIYKYSKLSGLPMEEAVGLPAQETAFGKYITAGRNYKTGQNYMMSMEDRNTRPDLITSDWLYTQPFLYVDMKLLNIDNKELLEKRKEYEDFIWDSSNNMKFELKELLHTRYKEAEKRAEADYINKHLKEFIKAEKEQTLEPPLLHAFNYYKSGKYNPGDPNYLNKVIKKGREVMNSPEFKKWYKTKK